MGWVFFCLPLSMLYGESYFFFRATTRHGSISAKPGGAHKPSDRRTAHWMTALVLWMGKIKSIFCHCLIYYLNWQCVSIGLRTPQSRGFKRKHTLDTKNIVVWHGQGALFQVECVSCSLGLPQVRKQYVWCIPLSEERKTIFLPLRQGGSIWVWLVVVPHPSKANHTQ